MKRTLWVIALLGYATLAVAAPNAETLKQGQKIYKIHCAVCHLNGTARAPRVHNQAAWKKRLKTAMILAKHDYPDLDQAALREKAIDILIIHTKQGMGAMPPGGMCSKCKDDEYRSAIEFMMSKRKLFKGS